MDADALSIADGVIQSLRAYVDREIAKLRAVIAAIPAGKDGAPGKDGASISVGDVQPMIIELVERAALALPVAKDGAPGRDGQSITLQEVAILVDATVAKAIGALPVPKDGAPGRDGANGTNGKDGAPGKDGEKGADGKPGEPGRDGVNGKDGAPGRDADLPIVDLGDVLDAIRADASMVAMLRGERGATGDPGLPGADGKQGEPGRDGASFTPEQVKELLDSRFAVWALEFERAAVDRQQRAIDAVPIPRDGRDGTNGKPGIGLDDFDLQTSSPDDGRTIVFELSAGGRMRRCTVKTACVLDRGIWQEGQRYAKGDGVTFGAQFWIAQVDDAQGKPGESKDWRLAVRRGKDGKDA